MVDYNRIDELVQKMHMSRRQLAEKAGIKQSTLSMWFFRKTGNISNEQIRAIANALDVSPSEILSKDALELLQEHAETEIMKDGWGFSDYGQAVRWKCKECGYLMFGENNRPTIRFCPMCGRRIKDG